MNQYYNQQPSPDMAKQMLKQFFNQNKLLVYLLLGVLVALIALGEGWHALFVVPVLYIGGALFKQYLGEQKMVNTLIYGALAGAVLYAAIFFQQFDAMHLAVAMIDSAVFALLVAVATYAPNFELQFFMRWRVKLKYVAMGIVVLGLLSFDFSENYRFAMVAGMLYGYLSIYVRGGNPYRQKNRFSIKDLFGSKKGPYVKGKKQKTTSSKQQTQAQRETDEEYNKRKQQEQAEIDKILDKVKQKGYESLSATEKQKLFEQKR